MIKKQLTVNEFRHIVKLANLTVDKNQEEKLSNDLSSILDIVSQLQNVSIKDISPTPQVTGLTNVFREDEIDPTRTLTQDETLSNAKSKYKGFFVVPAIFE